MSFDGTDSESSGRTSGVCHLCLRGGVLPVKWYGLPLHTRCHGAVRSRLRQQRQGGGDSREAQTNDKQLALLNPAAWRKKLMPFLSEDAAEKAKVRASTKEEARRVSKIGTVSGELHKDEDVVVNIFGFRHFAAINLGLDEDAADARFKKLHQAQQGEWDLPSGVKRVCAENPNARVVRFQGKQSSDYTEKVKVVAPEEERAQRMQILKASGSSGHSSRSVALSPPPSERLKASPMTTPSAKTTPKRTATFSEDVEDDDVDDPQDCKSECSAATKHVKPYDEDTTPSKRRRGPGVGATLLVAVDQVSKGVDDLLDKVVGEKASSLKQKLAQAVSNLATKGIKERHCPHASAELMSSIDALEASLRVLGRKVPDANTSAEVTTHKEKFGEYHEAFKLLQDQVNAQVEAMSYLKHKASTGQRAEYQSKRWMRQKILTHFVAGGHGEGIAKHFAELLSTRAEDTLAPLIPARERVQRGEWQLSVKQKDFDAGVPALWLAGEEDSPCAGFSAHTKEFGDMLRASEEALSAKLSEELKWHGVVTLVKAPIDAKQFFLGDVSPDLDGAVLYPWIVCSRPNTKRSGPTALPSPGVPCLISSRTHDIIVHASFADDVLAAGMHLQNYDRFCSSDEGRAHLSTTAYTAVLPKDAVAYIPPGCVFQTTWHQEPTKKKTKEEEVFSSLMVFPMVMGMDLLDKLPSNVKTALNQFNVDALAKKTQDMWKERLTLINKLFPVPPGAQR